MSSVAVRISEKLAGNARSAAKWSDRSVASQIEHWAKIGEAFDAVMSASEIEEIKKSGDTPEERARLLDFLAKFRNERDVKSIQNAIRESNSDKDLFETDPNDPDILIRISPDGSRTRGTLNGREFVPEK